MITQVPSSKAIRQRPVDSTASSKRYFLNSSRKINHFTSSSQQSISYVHSSQVNNKTLSPANFTQKIRQTPVQVIPNLYMELYDEFENNYKLVQKIKTDLNISIDIKQEDEAPQIMNLLSSQSIDKPKQTTTNIPNLQFCDIDNELNQRIQMNRFKFYYFRASIQRRQSPLYLSILFESQINSSQFKLYLSTLHEFPTKFNAEYNLTSNCIKMHTSGGEPYFDEQYLYITFYTEIEIAVKIRILFGWVQSLKTPKKVIKKAYPKFPGLNTIIRNDLIRRNLDTSQFSITKKLDYRVGFFSERESKRKQVLQKKIELDQESKILKKASINVQEMRNDYRLFEKLFKQQLFKKQQKQIFWLQIVNLFSFASELKKKLILFKRSISNKANGRLIALQYGLRLLINLKKFGPNTERRSFCKSLLAIKIFAHQISKLNQQKAGIIACSFIKGCISIIHLEHRLLKTRHYVIVLQNKFRFFKRQKKKFYDKFWNLLTQHYKEIIKSLTQGSKFRSRSQRSIYIYQIDYQIMQMQIENYLERQKQVWLHFIRQKIKQQLLTNYLSDRKGDEIRKALINFQEPILFRLPNLSEITEIIELYAKNKRMI